MKHGYLVGMKRRRNRNSTWLAAVDEAKWLDCPVGITARERSNPPRTRAQEITSGVEGMRVIIVDSDGTACLRTGDAATIDGANTGTIGEVEESSGHWESEASREDRGRGARVLQRNHGHRYYGWKLTGGASVTSRIAAASGAISAKSKGGM